LLCGPSFSGLMNRAAKDEQAQAAEELIAVIETYMK